MKQSYDYIVVGGGSSGGVAAAKLVTEGKARVLILEGGHSHRHRLLDMPPGIFKMINGSKFMRFHQTVPQEHLKRIAILDPACSTDAALAAHCKQFVKTNYHPSGNCGMGPNGGAMAVLDSRMRVRGDEHLRVCDLSAMPNINAGNTNAPAMMMESRCAALILQLAAPCARDWNWKASYPGELHPPHCHHDGTRGQRLE